jgi:CheY-like chemotaxis protein
VVVVTTVRPDTVLTHARDDAVSAWPIFSGGQERYSHQKALFISDRLRPLAPIDANSVISLAISPSKEDLSFLQRMFDDAGWKLLTAHTYQDGIVQLSRELIPVVLCECQVPGGDWKDVLSQLAPLLDPPRLIVVSRHANERLWSEVLDLGGFDLLATPFREVEVGYFWLQRM